MTGERSKFIRGGGGGERGGAIFSCSSDIVREVEVHCSGFGKNVYSGRGGGAVNTLQIGMVRGYYMHRKVK